MVEVYPAPPLRITARWPLKPFVVLATVAFILVRIPFLVALWTVSPGRRPNPKLPVPLSVLFDTLGLLVQLVGRAGLWSFRRGSKTIPKTGPQSPAKAIWVPPARSELLKGQIGEWIKVGNVDTVRVPAYWVGKDRHLDDPTARPGERVILNFHDGGYVDHSAHWTDPVSRFFGAAIHQLSKIASTKSGKEAVKVSRGLNVEYRLSHETNFAGIVADAMAAYSYLVETCRFEPAHVTIMGDSAGGNLTLALMRHLRDTKVLPMPGSAVLTSPWTDLSMATFSSTTSARANVRTDYLRDPTVTIARNNVIRNLPIGGLDSPYLSPGARHVVAAAGPNLYDNFPPALFIAGGKERWFDEIKLTYEDYAGTERRSAERRQALSSFYVEEELPHDYIAFMDMGTRQACLRTIQRMYDFLVLTQ